VSVTPVALPKHPGPLARGSQARRQRAYARAEEQIRHACEHAGLPEPDDVAVTRQPLLAGARPAGDFPAFRQMDHRQRKPTPRLLVHVALRFAEAIEGPVVLGSGRYFGLGLMRPLIEGVDT
jgi:CRISPR-associated protein Csb2